MSEVDPINDNREEDNMEETETSQKEIEKTAQKSSKLDSPPTTMQNCCPICYDTFNATVLIRLEPCSHAFCRDCLNTYCELSIQENRRPITISCPAQDCQSVFSEALLLQQVCISEETLRKYRQLQTLQDNPHLVECSSCQSLVNTTTTTTSLCPTCGHDINTITAECSSSLSTRANLKSERAINKLTKPCSHCGVRILHEGGCDHVVCWHCQQDFCWKCGTHLYLSGESTVRSCSSCRQRYLDHRKLNHHRLKSCLWLPITLPLTIIYVIFALFIFLASCGCGCFFLCGRVLVDASDKVKTKRLARLGVKVSLWMVVAPIFQLLNDFGVEMSPPDCFANLNGEQLDEKNTASEEEDDNDSVVNTSFRGDNAV